MDDKERIDKDTLTSLSDHNYNVTDFSENGEGQVFIQNLSTYEGTSASLEDVQERGAEAVFNDY